MRRVWLWVSVLSLAAALAAPAPASALGPGEAYAVTAMAVAPDAVTVPTALGTATADISVSVTSSPAVSDCIEDPTLLESGHVTARLTRVGSPEQYVDVLLDLAAGDRSAGTWTGRWRIGSGRTGTWQVTGVAWCNGEPFTGDYAMGYSVDPRSTLGTVAAVTVTAPNPVRLTITRVPKVSGYGSPQWQRLVYTDAHGVPLAGRTVALGTSLYCGMYGEGNSRVTLDASGAALVRVSPYPGCAMLVVPPTSTVTAATTVVRKDALVAPLMYYRWVRVLGDGGSFVVGSSARVWTTVYPAKGTVALQVRYGRTAWRTISTRTIATGWFALRIPATVNPALVLGKHTYRVVVTVPGTRYLAPTSSATFVLTGR